MVAFPRRLASSNPVGKLTSIEPIEWEPTVSDHFTEQTVSANSKTDVILHSMK
jgi:hypothetical protein